MAFRIATGVIAAILAEAAASPGTEVCGLLLGEAAPDPGDDTPSAPFAASLSKRRSTPWVEETVLQPAPPDRRGGGERLAGGTVTEARPCRNVAADPGRAFEIDPASLLAAYRRARAGGPAILGCYHSHPSALPEPSPRDAAAAAANGWLWLIAAAGEVRGWRAVEGGERHGRFDPAIVAICD